MAKAPPLPMLPWWPRDYLAATRGWTLAEKGAYTDLLFISWDIGPLPQESARLARMVGIDYDEFMRIWPIIGPKFVVASNGKLINERLERERKNSKELRSKAAAKAKSAADARWGRDASSNAECTASGIRELMPEECHPTPSPKPSAAATSARVTERDLGNRTHTRTSGGNNQASDHTPHGGN